MDDVVDENVLDDALDNGLGDDDPGAVFSGNDEILITPAVEEKPAHELGRCEAILERNRCDAPLIFFQRILQADVPGRTGAVEIVAEQVLPADERDLLDQGIARLAGAAGRYSRADELSDRVAPE